MKKITIICVLICTAISSFSQTFKQSKKLSQQYYQQAKYKEAIKEYENLASFYDNWAYPLSMIAICYRNLCNANESLRYLHKALDITPYNPDCLIDLGDHYILSNNYDSAAYYYKKADEHGDSRGFATNGMAQILFDNGEYKAALTKINQAIEEYPKAPGHYILRADIKMAMGDTTDILLDINKAIKLDPKEGGLYSFRAGYFFDRKNYAAAKVDVEKSLSMNPNDDLGLYYKAGLLYLEGKEDEALQVFEKYYLMLKECENSFFPEKTY